MHELELTVDESRSPGSWWWVLAEPSGREIARYADQVRAGDLGPIVDELMRRGPVVVRAGGPRPALDLLARSFETVRVAGRSLEEHGITLVVGPDEEEADEEARAVAPMGEVCRECGRLDGRHASWCSRA